MIIFGRHNVLYQLLLYSSFGSIVYYRLLTEYTSGIRTSEPWGEYDLPDLSRSKILVDLPDNSLPNKSSKTWTKDHFSQLGKSLARPFVVQSRQVCSRRPMIKNKNIEKDGLKFVSPEGFFYVKMPKAASSTLAGVNKRIAIKQGQRLYNNATIAQNSTTTCTHNEAHVLGPGMMYGNREPTKSFLWASLRDPASRAMSRIFFSHVSQFGRPPTDERILSALHENTKPREGTISDGQGGFQLRYLSLEPIEKWSAWNETAPTSVQNPAAIHRDVEQVIQNYDFLALTERLDESLVAMRLLLDLPVSDILSASSKVGGAYFYVNNKSKSPRCIPLQKSFRSPVVQAYLESDEWYAQNYGDYLLYAAANRSLDMTIERSGKERFAEALVEYHDAMKLVKKECEARTIFPCSSSGKAQLKLSKENCYRGDAGCGYPCIDELEREGRW